MESIQKINNPNTTNNTNRQMSYQLWISFSVLHQTDIHSTTLQYRHNSLTNKDFTLREELDHLMQLWHRQHNTDYDCKQQVPSVALRL